MPSTLSIPGSGTLDTGVAHSGQADTIRRARCFKAAILSKGQLGVGGMSTVYRGRDLRFKDVVRSCAIKEMYQLMPDSQTRVLRLKNFEREASLLATLSHPAIPKVYDFFSEHGKVYLVMELIAGHDLSATLDIGVVQSTKLVLDGGRCKSVWCWSIFIHAARSDHFPRPQTFEHHCDA